MADAISCEECEDNLLSKLLFKLIPKDPQGDDADLRVISILNSEAMCKTALARSAYGEVAVKRRFDCRAWIHVRDNSSVREVLANILRQISTRDLEDVDRADEENLSRSLYGYIFGQRYLIVLDNMNSVDVMVKLLGFLVDSSNGSRVMITTANVELPPFVDRWADPIKFDPLSKEDRKLLLWPWLDENKRKQLLLSKEQGEQVPPAQSPLAKNISRWCSLKENPSLVDIVSSCYEELSPELQRCTMHVCQFPREYDIPTRRLLRLWLAEGLVPELNRGIEEAKKCFLDLESKNMIYVVSRGKGHVFPKTCRMPGFIYDILLQKALVAKFFNICRKDSTASIPSKEVKRIVVDNGRSSFLKQQESDQTQHNAKQICSYISFNTNKIREQKGELDICLITTGEEGEKCELKVLDLEGVYKPVLPKDLGKVFSKLRYLGLRWTILSELPKSVGDLPYLETLDVKHTNITNIPSSIWTKKSLHHLYLNELNLDKSIPHRRRLSPFRKTPKVHNLQTLCGLRLEAKSPILDVLGKLTGITKLSLTCSSTVIKKVIKIIKGLKKLQSLRLKSKDMLGQPSEFHLEDMRGLESVYNLYLFGNLRSKDLSILPSNLKSLTMSMSFLTDVELMDHLGKMKRLNDLRLYGHSYLGTTLKFSKQMFPELCTLKMWKLDKLKELIVEEEALPCLKELDIRDCRELKNIDIVGSRIALELSLTRVKTELVEGVKAFHRFIITTTELIAPASEGHAAT